MLARGPSRRLKVAAAVQDTVQADKPPLNISKGIWVRCTYVLKTLALVILQQTVLCTELAVAEAAIPNYPLGSVPAVRGRTSDLLGSHFVFTGVLNDNCSIKCLACCVELWCLGSSRKFGALMVDSC